MPSRTAREASADRQRRGRRRRGTCCSPCSTSVQHRPRQSPPQAAHRLASADKGAKAGGSRPTSECGSSSRSKVLPGWTQDRLKGGGREGGDGGARQGQAVRRARRPATLSPSPHSPAPRRRATPSARHSPCWPVGLCAGRQGADRSGGAGRCRAPAADRSDRGTGRGRASALPQWPGPECLLLLARPRRLRHARRQCHQRPGGPRPRLHPQRHGHAEDPQPATAGDPGTDPGPQQHAHVGDGCSSRSSTSPWRYRRPAPRSPSRHSPAASRSRGQDGGAAAGCRRSARQSTVSAPA